MQMCMTNAKIGGNSSILGVQRTVGAWYEVPALIIWSQDRQSCVGEERDFTKQSLKTELICSKRQLPLTPGFLLLTHTHTWISKYIFNI